jgi:hypothetical protein
MGAGSKPEKGKEAAEESLSEVLESLSDCNMLFLAAGKRYFNVLFLTRIRWRHRNWC